MSSNHFSIIETAPAKINLFLEVLHRRPDGYHDLDSLIVFADVGERLSAQSADDIALEITGPMAGALISERNNLILRAAELLRLEAGIKMGAHLHLEKHIPVAAGVGGGSADAAATLRVLDKLWGLGADEQDLMHIGLKLGADVPVCVRSRASRFEGVGEICTDAPSLPSGLAILLANPGVGVSTKDVFAKVTPKSLQSGRGFPDAFVDFDDLVHWLRLRRNDLMTPAMEIEPIVEECLDLLKSCVMNSICRMSGSGATCFALFASLEDANRAAEMIERVSPQFWVRSVLLM